MLAVIVQFPGKYHGYKQTTSDNELWLCCVPYYGQLMRIQYRVRHQLLLKGPSNEQ